MYPRVRLATHWITPPHNPIRLVALFHGLGGSRFELVPTAERWTKVLRSTAFLLLQAPDQDYHQRELLSGDFSGDWYRFPRLRSEFGADEAAYTRMVETCLSDRCDHVSQELDRHLADIGLGELKSFAARRKALANLVLHLKQRRVCPLRILEPTSDLPFVLAPLRRRPTHLRRI